MAFRGPISGSIPKEISINYSLILMTMAGVYNKQRKWNIDHCWEGLQHHQIFDYNPKAHLFVLVPISLMEFTMHVYLSWFVFKQDKEVKHMLISQAYR